MSTTQATNTPRDTPNLRIPRAGRELIYCAAAFAGKTPSDFILEAVLRAVEETLLDRALMVVSPEAYAELLKWLDRSAQPNERIRKTMQSKCPRSRPNMAGRPIAAGADIGPATGSYKEAGGNCGPRGPELKNLLVESLSARIA
ncbi:DUF1778 domain-containing protein [Pseudoduganella sp.]|uniref:type II toxin-antitoxin system TacA family antitoxin n=1 Tax=Pseudoduganella sp. TaxID=1880898 RepID=UPI0035AF5DD1